MRNVEVFPVPANAEMTSNSEGLTSRATMATCSSVS